MNSFIIVYYSSSCPACQDLLELYLRFFKLSRRFLRLLYAPAPALSNLHRPLFHLCRLPEAFPISKPDAIFSLVTPVGTASSPSTVAEYTTPLTNCQIHTPRVSHLRTPQNRLPQGHLIRIFQITPYRQTVRQPRHPHPQRRQQTRDVHRRRFPL